MTFDPSPMQYMETLSLAEKIRACLDPIRLARQPGVGSSHGDKTPCTPVPLRHELQAWDLQSLLIKPVQRVLKYPLLLDKLVEFTEDGHPDRKALHGAKGAIGQMAQDINELKRRKDIGEFDNGCNA